jgi:CheY-like chemotaxis protein
MPAQYPAKHGPHVFSPANISSNLEKPRLFTHQLERLQVFTMSYPVLATDDDSMSRALHRSIFDQHGLVLIDTHSSIDALHICKTQAISLVISDIMKPHMDGLEMLHDLRADSLTRHIPLIFVTATNHTEEIAFQTGADAFIRKPFHPDELLWAVWRLLSNRIK